MRFCKLAVVFVFLIALCVSVQASNSDQPAVPSSDTSNAPALTADRVIDRFLQRELALTQAMRRYHPLVETYFQNTRPDRDLGSVPAGDKYFLGRLDLGDGMQERFYTAEVQRGLLKTLLHPVLQMYTLDISPIGFSNMVFIDRGRFDRNHYAFKFVRREFLGEVRTLVFDVAPKKDVRDHGMFLGRIWVEDHDYNIVRFNGTYTNPGRGGLYFHMDSWRENMRGDLWLPSHVYCEEADMLYGVGRTLRFKSSTRLWGYDLKSAGHQEEFTQMVVENAKDESENSQDETTPVLSMRAWQRQAEDNAIDRLEKAGLIARAGDVDKVLETVVNNLQITNNLDIQPEVRCRVMLTTPLESFTIGHTIVISRGLVDVLPDEASLAMVLAHELAHIALGDQIDTKYAFADRMGASDEDSLNVFRFQRDQRDEASADQRALELLKNSPYKDKLGNVGLFLRTLQLRANALQSLLTPRLGNGLTVGDKVTRMSGLMAGAPELQMHKLDQIPALPLGGRVNVDPWDDSISLVKARPVPLLSQKEKMPFEVTPMISFLKRYDNGGAAAAPTSVGTTTPTAPASAGATATPAGPAAEAQPAPEGPSAN
jgi:Peptidase family M48